VPAIAIALAAGGAGAQTVAPTNAVLAAQEDVELGNGASVTGGVIGTGVGLGNGANIGGPIEYVNRFDPGRGGRLSEAARRVDAIHPLSLPEIPTDPGQGVGLGHGEDLFAGVGSFGGVEAGNGATLRLGSGAFAFGGVEAGQNFALVADTAAGDVTVTFDGSFEASNGLSIENAGPGVLRLIVRDGFEAGHGASIRAAVFAGGDVELGNGAFVFGGLFAGGSIEAGHGLRAVRDPVSLSSASARVPGGGSAACVAIAGVLASRRRRAG